MYKNYKIVALCVSKIHTDVIFTFIEKLNTALKPYNYRILVFQTISDLFNKSLNSSGEVTVFELIPYNIVDYIVIYDEYLWDKECVKSIISKASEYSIPVVNIETEYDNCFTLTYEQDEGFENVVRHIIEEHKLTDICLISGYPETPFCIARENCFKKVLAANNIPFTNDMLYYGGLWYLPTRQVTEKIIASGHLPQAIMCVNDFTAITVIETLKEHNIRVPEDVIVSGFDGTDEAEYFVPSITTSKGNVDKAIKQLAGLFEKLTKEKLTPHKISAPFALRLGASCGCGQNHIFKNAGKILKASDERLQGYIEIEQRLYDITERLVLSDNLDLFLESLNQLDLHNVSVMVNKDFLSSTINPLAPNRDLSFDDELIVVFTDEGSSIDKLFAMPRSELIPNFDTLIDNGNPFVFSALCFLGNPMGYICFNYETAVNNFCLIPQYVTALNRIFGDYRNVRYLKQVADSMEDLSCRDYMTNLFNRNGFYKHLDDFLLLTSDSAEIVVASVDMDGLKRVNDTYGHDAGDYAISTIARAIDEIDVHHKIAARFGGDEFVLCAVMNEGNNADDLTNIIRLNLETFQNMDKPFRVNVSIGYATCDKASFDIDRFLKESDEKMYVDKEGKPHRRV